MSVSHVALGELIEPAKTRKAGELEYPLLSMTMAGGLVDPLTKFKKRVASEDTSGYKIVSRGQLVVGFPIDEGVLSFQHLHDEAIVSPAYGIWDLNARSVVDPAYLEKYLKSPHAITYYLGKLRSTTARRRSLDRGSFLALPVPLPPLEEQKRIAGILDQAAELCRLRTRAHDKLNSLGQAIFHEMFVANGSADWAAVSVDEVTANMRTGPFGSQLLHAEFVEEGIPVLGIDNVVSNEFRWAKARYISSEKYEQLKRYTVLPGDVLITIMGTCGRCAVVPDDIPTAINTKHLCCLSLDRERVEPKFMQAAFLHHPDVLRQLGVEAKGAVMPGMNMGIIKALKLPLPPLSLQLDFAARLKKVSVAQSKALSAMKSADALFAALQHRAFCGEL